ncbi:MAG: DNA repair protein RadA [Oscillospiraceae bacterium]|nr:DNA repair protein RadA [Oscillospiraceae bacterium]
MAGKLKTFYVCSQCGYKSNKWAGKCPECESWNSFNEEVVSDTPALKNNTAAFTGAKAKTPLSVNSIEVNDEVRYKTGIGEFDRILGGGLVKGSIILLGGEPGVGKSTLILQICEALSKDKTILYVSGEESLSQLKLRFNRLKIKTDNLYVLTETDVESIIDTATVKKPDIMIIDSIQTMNLSTVNSSAGSVSQVRESTNAFMHLAKSEDISTIVIGHVNKDGLIAGPKVLEHIVDAVIYFEGDKNFGFKILRAAKNRFGSTNEIGIFEMSDTGLVEVKNPSASLLEGRMANISGSCIACAMEGSRPILVEIQALVSKSGFGQPRRVSVGFDYNRMNLILAVLEKRAGFFFGNLDVYINVVGGLRLDEPSADLPVAMALISAITDKTIPDNAVAFGELGLSGEVRTVNGINLRIKEAQRMGFNKIYMPSQAITSKDESDIKKIRHIREIKL